MVWLQAHAFKVEDQAGSFLCGPPGLIEKAAAPGLKKLGFKDDESLFGF